jgi:hypothetical protein
MFVDQIFMNNNAIILHQTRVSPEGSWVMKGEKCKGVAHQDDHYQCSSICTNRTHDTT